MTPDPKTPYNPLEAAASPGRRKCLLFAAAVLPCDIDLLEQITSRYPPEPGRYSWFLPPLLPQLRDAITVIERSAEGEATPAEEDQVRETILSCKEATVIDQDVTHAFYLRDLQDLLLRPSSQATGGTAPHAEVAWALSCAALAGHPDLAADAITEVQRSRYRRYLEDIFGSSPRPVAFDAAWQTDTAVSLAKHIYESRDFFAMPILADALQDAGCDNADILTHCRDESLTHVRGCWVVDLVLGKS